MKKHIYLILCLALLCGACQKYSEETPEACLTMSIITGKDDSGRDVYEPTTTAEVGQSVFFGHCSDADKFAIYAGDEGHVYGEQNAIGLNLSSIEDNFANYAYGEPGTYTVTLVATNTSMGSPDVTFTRDMATAEITITAAK